MANSDNIRAAMEATEQYGIHSSEARLAWEVVEEFDARTNDKAAYTPDENGLSKLTQDQIDNAYWELQQSIEFMQQNQYTGFNSLQNNQELMKDIAVELSAIKLSPPDNKPGAQISGLWDAKLRARAMTENFGVYSNEAKVAWEEVEEIASSGLGNSIGAGIDVEECDLTKAAEACLALEELNRFFTSYYAQNNIMDEDASY
eukprot:CAMPEP_0184855280 /NCGR_PEP_ID=MMETSP0580-20130426/574_1 /TAXON_ID=1118495 /ORGANISM="Dactyliosolen fragilissimus" /LENGTH=201 /DNA_ID=CAMNT_0027349755 /DNA_START=194 /DNA_END=799 /DNA_ORIENTATION=+